MIKEITNEVHWFTLFVFVNVVLTLLCVTFGVVCFVCCVGLTAVTALVTYRMLIGIVERKKPMPSSTIIDILKRFNVLTTTATATSIKTSSTTTSIDSLETKCVQPSENRFFDERNSCAVGGVMFEVDLYVQYIMRDFVVSWYQSLSPNEQFTCEIQYALEDLSVALVSRVRKLGMHLLLHKVFCVYHRYFLSYLDALSAVRHKYQFLTLENSMGCTDAVQGCFTGWHYALVSPATEIHHLYNVVNILLEVMVPADVLSCTLSRKLVVTLLVYKVLLPLVDLFSNPHWLNQKIIALTASSKQIASLTDVTGYSMNSASENKSIICHHSSNVEDSGLCRTGSSLSVGPVAAASAEDGNNFFEFALKADTSPVEPVSGHTENDGKDELETNFSTVDTAEGIWQRMAGELPAAFSSERNQEVSELVQEASANLERKKPSKIPLSGSLEKISDMFSSAISFESISINFAQYFKLGTDESKPSSTIQCPDVTDKNVSDESDFVDNINELSHTRNYNKASLNQNIMDCKGGGDEINPSFHVSSVLERLLPMTTGPVLSEQLVVSSKAALKDDQLCSMTTPESATSDTRKTEPLEYSHIEIQQHDSSKTSCKSNRSDNSMETDINTLTPDLSKTDDEQCSFEPFGSTFMNLAIVGAEIVNENHPGAPYVVYCIQYEAWYHDPNSIKLVDVDHYVDILEPNAILQKGSVRRRFREFVTLHNRLEEDPKLRPLIKGVKGPNKWLVLPFNKLDKEAIADRKLFLENYLQILISKEEIASSSHLREFLAYGNDPSIAYVRKAADTGLPVPRIDKFLMRTVTGVFDKLKTALPSLPHDPSPIEPTINLQKTSDRLLGFLNFTSPLTDEPALRISFDFVSDTEYSQFMEECLAHFLGTYDVNYDKVDTAYEAGEMDTWMKDPWSSIDGNTTGNQECESISAERTYIHSENTSPLDDEMPLANAILNLIADTVQSDYNRVNQERLVHVVKIILGPLLERWASELIDAYSSEEMFVKYLKKVREMVWPYGMLPHQTTNSPTEFDNIRNYNVALQALNEYFPSVIVLLLGRAQYESGMKLFLDSLQHPKLLRHLVYHLMDLLVDVLLIRSRSQSIIEKLASLS